VFWKKSIPVQLHCERTSDKSTSFTDISWVPVSRPLLLGEQYLCLRIVFQAILAQDSTVDVGVKLGIQETGQAFAARIAFF
jgi:hypothetical protein